MIESNIIKLCKKKRLRLLIFFFYKITTVTVPGIASATYVKFIISYLIFDLPSIYTSTYDYNYNSNTFKC